MVTERTAMKDLLHAATQLAPAGNEGGLREQDMSGISFPSCQSSKPKDLTASAASGKIRTSVGQSRMSDLLYEFPRETAKDTRMEDRDHGVRMNPFAQNSTTQQGWPSLSFCAHTGINQEPSRGTLGVRSHQLPRSFLSSYQNYRPVQPHYPFASHPLQSQQQSRAQGAQVIGGASISFIPDGYLASGYQAAPKHPPAFAPSGSINVPSSSSSSTSSSSTPTTSSSCTSVSPSTSFSSNSSSDAEAFSKRPDPLLPLAPPAALATISLPPSARRSEGKRARRTNLSGYTPGEKQERRKERARMYSAQVRERQNAELHALRQQVQALSVYKLMVDEAPEIFAVLSADSQAKVLYANAAFARFFLCHPESCVGRSVWEVVHREDKETVMGAFASAVMEKEEVRWARCRLGTSKGQGSKEAGGAGREVPVALSVRRGTQGLILVIRRED